MDIKAKTALIQRNATFVERRNIYTLNAPGLTATEEKEDLKQDNTGTQKQGDDMA